MIAVRLLGGAKKSFQTDLIYVRRESMTVQELLDHLLSEKPRDAPDLDTENILVAINGADSSALGGRSAIVRAGDTVTIIPVIHGGSPRVRFRLAGRSVEVFSVKHDGDAGPQYLDDLRAAFPKLTIQAVSKRYVLSRSHVQKILAVSLHAKRRNIMLSKKLETDILMRFAGTGQISRAISRAGIGTGEFLIIAIGPRALLDRLYHALGPGPGREFFTAGERFLMREFEISKKHLAATSSPAPLEDILAENAAVLF